MRSTPSVRNVPNVAFEMVPILVSSFICKTEREKESCGERARQPDSQPASQTDRQTDVGVGVRAGNMNYAIETAQQGFQHDVFDQSLSLYLSLNRKTYLFS